MKSHATENKNQYYLLYCLCALGKTSSNIQALQDFWMIIFMRIASHVTNGVSDFLHLRMTF